jgi:hypothetical protein
MNKLKLKRDELIIDIVKLAIMITESKDFSIEVELSGFVGMFGVSIHFQDSDKTIKLINNWECFSHPMKDKLWHEKYLPNNYKAVNKELENCKQTLNDLLLDKISVDELTKLSV